MRHRNRGRILGRSPSHRKAMLRNLASSFFLTMRDDDYYDGLVQADGKTQVNMPSQKGRVVTTLHKAKEVRSLVEKCITIARRALEHEENARQYETDAERNTDEWHAWRKSERWQQWNAAISPSVAARRRVFSILRDKEAVSILFDEIASRFTDRPGGYTRIIRLAKPRLGDSGTQALLELVGENDRVRTASEKPAFADEDDDREDVRGEDASADED